jgi:hypothetical protein
MSLKAAYQGTLPKNAHVVSGSKLASSIGNYKLREIKLKIIFVSLKKIGDNWEV